MASSQNSAKEQEIAEYMNHAFVIPPDVKLNDELPKILADAVEEVNNIMKRIRLFTFRVTNSVNEQGVMKKKR